jgi:hypothetical protein
MFNAVKQTCARWCYLLRIDFKGVSMNYNIVTCAVNSASIISEGSLEAIPVGF